MKKFENLGRNLSKDEQKKIKGGDPDPDPIGNGCSDDQDTCGMIGGVEYKCCATFICINDICDR